MSNRKKKNNRKPNNPNPSAPTATNEVNEIKNGSDDVAVQTENVELLATPNLILEEVSSDVDILEDASEKISDVPDETSIENAAEDDFINDVPTITEDIPPEKSRGKRKKLHKKESEPDVVLDDEVIPEVILQESDSEPQQLPEEKVQVERVVDESSPAYLAKLVIVLTAICMSIALLLAVVNNATKDIISANAEREKSEAVLAVFPEGTAVEAYETAAGDEVYIILKDNEIVGYCINAVETGYGGDVSMMIGVDTAKKIHGIKIVSMSETPGVGTKINADSFLNRFIGMDEPAEIDGNVDGISGATFSSRAVAAGVTTALSANVDFEDAALKFGVSIQINGETSEEYKNANAENGDDELDIKQAGESGVEDEPIAQPPVEPDEPETTATDPTEEPEVTVPAPTEQTEPEVPTVTEPEPVEVIEPEPAIEPDPIPSTPTVTETAPTPVVEPENSEPSVYVEPEPEEPIYIESTSPEIPEIPENSETPDYTDDMESNLTEELENPDNGEGESLSEEVSEPDLEEPIEEEPIATEESSESEEELAEPDTSDEQNEDDQADEPEETEEKKTSTKPIGGGFIKP